MSIMGGQRSTEQVISGSVRSRVAQISLTTEFLFLQAEAGIRCYKVTGVQTCALPIWRLQPLALEDGAAADLLSGLSKEERAASWHLVTKDREVHSGGAALHPLLRLLPGGAGLAVVDRKSVM